MMIMMMRKNDSDHGFYDANLVMMLILVIMI